MKHLLFTWNSLWWTCDETILLSPTDSHASQSEDGSMQLTLTIKFWWRVLPQVQEETGEALWKERKAETSNSLASYTHKHRNINLLDFMPVFTLLAPSVRCWGPEISNTSVKTGDIQQNSKFVLNTRKRNAFGSSVAHKPSCPLSQILETVKWKTKKHR